MIQKIPCRVCRTLILPATAAANEGLCWPCKRGTRQHEESRAAKIIRERERRTKEQEEQAEELRRRYRLLEEFRQLTDAQLLARLEALPPLADENDPIWTAPDYWHRAAEVYLALAEACAERRLRFSISLLLDRACYGDPGEIMRRLRHCLEAIVTPDWSCLADICLERARSPRMGTRLWAIDQLVVLDDPRARSVFEHEVKVGLPLIADIAGIGLSRLTGGTPN